jgi:choline dehydrogenase
MCRTQTTIHRGRRMSAAHCYLEPARRRPNLQVRTGALALSLCLEDQRCVGVRYSLDGRTVEANARTEIILCAGSINTPQLLEISGVGRPEVLTACGIEVRHELPGVGENLRDHIAPRLKWGITGAGLTYNDRARGLRLLWQIARYAIDRGGFLNLPSGPMLAFFRTREELESPDIQLHFVPFLVASIANKRELAADPGMTIACYQLRPESTGSVHVRSPDPRTAPAIRFNFLSDPIDREALLAAVRFTRRIIGARAMDDIRGAELAPGPSLQSDEDLLGWIRATAETAYHPVGTCKMGQDAMAVVDERLRVHGLAGLRVADGSIMPTLVSGNTNAPCIMIGEKAAEMILEDATRAATA